AGRSSKCRACGQPVTVPPTPAARVPPAKRPPPAPGQPLPVAQPVGARRPKLLLVWIGVGLGAALVLAVCFVVAVLSWPTGQVGQITVSGRVEECGWEGNDALFDAFALTGEEDGPALDKFNKAEKKIVEGIFIRTDSGDEYMCRFPPGLTPTSGLRRG